VADKPVAPTVQTAVKSATPRGPDQAKMIIIQRPGGGWVAYGAPTRSVRTLQRQPIRSTARCRCDVESLHYRLWTLPICPMEFRDVWLHRSTFYNNNHVDKSPSDLRNNASRSWLSPLNCLWPSTLPESSYQSCLIGCPVFVFVI
jgi:hypothetical protein